MRNTVKTGTVFAVLMFMIFSCCFCFSVSAADNNTRLFDYDNSISDSEESRLNELIQTASQKEQINIAVVFTSATQGKSSMDYADDFYDDLFGINTDGILLLVDHCNSNVWISTSGSALITYDVDRMPEMFSKLLHKGKNVEAVEKFIEYTDPDLLTKEIKIKDTKKSALIGFGISLIVAVIVFLVIRSSYAANPPVSARNYVSGNGVNLSVKQDRFLRTTTTKSVIESDSGRGGGSTHISSSGGTHGGAGGRI